MDFFDFPQGLGLNAQYLAVIDWMRYSNDWIPSKVKILSLYDHSMYTVIPDPRKLKHFNVDDILVNQKLPKCPLKNIMDSNFDSPYIFRVPLWNFKNFLKFSLYNKLNTDDNWKATIATVHKSDYHYLNSCMSADIVYWGNKTNSDEMIFNFVERIKNEKKPSQVGIPNISFENKNSSFV